MDSGAKPRSGQVVPCVMIFTTFHPCLAQPWNQLILAGGHPNEILTSSLKFQWPINNAYFIYNNITYTYIIIYIYTYNNYIYIYNII